MTTSAATAADAGLEARLLPIADLYRGKEGAAIPLLAAMQKEMGYIAPEAVEFMARELDIPAAKLFGVATFYAQFHLSPRGRHIIRVCRGTACHVRGSLKILERIKDLLEVGENQTTEDLRFTLEPVACLGACGLAPVMTIGDSTFGRLNPDMVKGILDKFE
jgi:NADH-quinone oxidoreductase subunit E